MAEPKKWIKFWVKNLYDPNIAKLPDWLWRRKFEFDLMAGERNEDGALPPVEDMLWTLRLDEAKLSQALQMLAEVGEVHEDPPGSGQWYVTNYQELQETPAAERMRRKRERDKSEETNDYANSYANSSENNHGNSSSTSSSLSSSESFSESSSDSLELLLDSWNWQPKTPKEAVGHPALQIFDQVAGGIPGERDYNKVIQWLILIARKYQLKPEQLPDYLAPYCLAWTSQIGQNGRNYDPLNVNWLLQAYNQTLQETRPAGQNGSKNKPMSAIDKIEQEIREKGSVWKPL